jgi:hypothetical protein
MPTTAVRSLLHSGAHVLTLHPAECTRLEKDRDGCPKIVNLGASRTDLFYERKKSMGFKRG